VIYVGNSWGGDPSTAAAVGTNYYFPVPGWTRVDTSLYYKWHNYNFALNVQNVGDRQYFVSSTNITQLLPGDLRKFTLSARATF
jgi:outer membrane receptor protein involved in Fe transport